MKAGSMNMMKINESIKTIELLTSQYKKKRITTEFFIKSINENLLKLTSERNYHEYLKGIGQ